MVLSSPAASFCMPRLCARIANRAAASKSPALNSTTAWSSSWRAVTVPVGAGSVGGGGVVSVGVGGVGVGGVGVGGVGGLATVAPGGTLGFIPGAGSGTRTVAPGAGLVGPLGIGSVPGPAGIFGIGP